MTIKKNSSKQDILPVFSGKLESAILDYEELRNKLIEFNQPNTKPPKRISSIEREEGVPFLISKLDAHMKYLVDLYEIGRDLAERSSQLIEHNSVDFSDRISKRLDLIELEKNLSLTRIIINTKNRW